MITLSHLWPFVVLYVSNVARVSGAQVELSSIVMQLRSEVDTDNSVLLSEMLSKTTTFLDEYFGAYYERTGNEDAFSHSALSVDSFGIHGVQGSFITTLEFEGLLFFSAENAPPEEFISALLENAFSGKNQEIYLNLMMDSSSSQFLQSMTHIIIEVDNKQVSEYTQDDLDASKNGASDSLNDSPFWKDEKTIQTIIHVGAVLGGGILCILLICLLKCMCRSYYDDVDSDSRSDTPSYAKSFQNAPTRSESSNGSSEREKRSYPQPKHFGGLYRINRVARTRSQPQNEESVGGLSPSHSMASQESSLFTYNPSYLNNSKTNNSMASISNLQLDLPSMDLDLESSKRQDTISPVTPAPFGTDISAIEKSDKDLSLIAEEDEDYAPISYERRSTYQAVTVPARARNFNAHHQSKLLSNGGRGHPDSSMDESVDSTTSNVINDLNNLSLQIDKYRGGHR